MKNRAAQHDDLEGPRPEQAGDRERGSDDRQLVARAQVASELLGRRADPDECRPGIFDESCRTHPDQPFLARVLKGTGVECHVEGARDVCRGPSVGLTQESVALQAPDVAPDRHLRDTQLASQLADMDRLLGGDAFEDAVAPVDRIDGVTFQRLSRCLGAGVRRRYSFRHPHPSNGARSVDEGCSIVFDYRRTGRRLSRCPR